MSSRNKYRHCFRTTKVNVFLASVTGEQTPATVQLESVSVALRTLQGKNATSVVLNILETQLLIHANVRTFDFI